MLLAQPSPETTPSHANDALERKRGRSGPLQWRREVRVSNQIAMGLANSPVPFWLLALPAAEYLLKTRYGEIGPGVTPPRTVVSSISSG
jgi:hypothetical protein